MPGEAEEASLAVPPPVLTLGVNRNIKSLLGGQETGNNQNTVSCPRPGHWAACHRPSTAAWGFPSLASTQAAALGRGVHRAHAPGHNHETPGEAGSHAAPTGGPARRHVITGLEPRQPSDPKGGG